MFVLLLLLLDQFDLRRIGHRSVLLVLVLGLLLEKVLLPVLQEERNLVADQKGHNPYVVIIAQKAGFHL